MKKVSTTDGPMYVAGSLWSLGALFIDLVFIQLIIFIALSLFWQVTFEALLNWTSWLPGLVAIGYGILAYRHSVPSLGNWALALKKYPRSSVEGYAGKGMLLLMEDLTLSTRLGRLAIAILVLVSLFFVLITGFHGSYKTSE